MTPNRPDPSSRDRLAAVARDLIAPVLVVSREGVVEYVNQACAAMLRQEPAWLLGRTFAELVHPADRPRVKNELAAVVRNRPSGRFSQFRARGHNRLSWQVLEGIFNNLLHDPDIAGVLVSCRE